jgi:hypothetical protein
MTALAADSASVYEKRRQLVRDYRVPAFRYMMRVWSRRCWSTVFRTCSPFAEHPARRTSHSRPHTKDLPPACAHDGCQLIRLPRYASRLWSGAGVFQERPIPAFLPRARANSHLAGNSHLCRSRIASTRVRRLSI